MISNEKNREREYQENMRGGNGKVMFENLFDAKIPHIRLLKVIALEPGSSIGAHEHTDEAEIFYALNGEATVLDGGEWVTLQPGDAHLCAHGETHSLQNRSDKTASVLAIIPTVAE
jgi:quercetin dioxygenase-like cupin family protein